MTLLRVENIITLNKPTTPKDLIQKTKINNKRYDIRTTGDLVSVLQPLKQDRMILFLVVKLKTHIQNIK